MKLNDALGAFYANSEKASDGVRTLALAGVGVVWVFRQTSEASTCVPRDLTLPLVLFCAALAFDLLQYVTGTLVWGVYHRYREMRVGLGNDVEFLAPVALNWPINAFFAAKVVAVVTGYVLLIEFLAGRM